MQELETTGGEKFFEPMKTKIETNEGQLWRHKVYGWQRRIVGFHWSEQSGAMVNFTEKITTRVRFGKPVKLASFRNWARQNGELVKAGKVGAKREYVSEMQLFLRTLSPKRRRELLATIARYGATNTASAEPKVNEPALTAAG